MAPSDERETGDGGEDDSQGVELAIDAADAVQQRERLGILAEALLGGIGALVVPAFALASRSTTRS